MLGQGWAGLLVDDGRGLVHVSDIPWKLLDIFFNVIHLLSQQLFSTKWWFSLPLDKLYQGWIPPSPRCRMEMQKDEQRQQKMAKRPSSWTCFGVTGFPKLRVGFGDENGVPTILLSFCSSIQC